MDAAVSACRTSWEEHRNKLTKKQNKSQGLNVALSELLQYDTSVGSEHELLSLLLDLRDMLEPLDFLAHEKSKVLKKLKYQYRVGTLVGLSRRLGPHVRPPPEYNDPAGTDAFCVPGYVFPCPDVAMMLRSTLFMGGSPSATVRSLPPDIDAELLPGFTAAYKLTLTSDSPGANFFYSVNLDSYRPFNPAQPPTLSAPGEYTIQAYAVAPNFNPSEAKIKTLRLVVQEGGSSAASGVSSSPSEVAVAKPKAEADSVFG
eukprot:Blabericola_migrator_1__2053@NODE_1562_length_4269_cov_136_374108_g173_i2_p3_GENE_NODE_1562_length_4269_cov_136_374108_g173_i2NODE_1562_length_4269_cov_136_374108_g173_i2_p3_ORF_typecomplete_len258_score52_17CHB_HEX_C_1/PF13290_6/0_014_NODE_1562_length_4269_cov_136_374108_g173_i232824055